jgi:hypothetical protein
MAGLGTDRHRSCSDQTGLTASEHWLISRRDESIPLPNMMYEEITSAVNQALFQEKAPAAVRIMKANRNARGTVAAITHQNATAEMALLYQDIIINPARSVDKEVIDVE